VNASPVIDAFWLGQLRRQINALGYKLNVRRQKMRHCGNRRSLRGHVTAGQAAESGGNTRIFVLWLNLEMRQISGIANRATILPLLSG
jgi:hypothetical protein